MLCLSMAKLLVATRNQHKLEEMREIFHGTGIELVGADDIDGLPEVEEDGNTFEANAIKKASTLALASGQWTMADDSGLEVTALSMRPGVWSARYAGKAADPTANNSKLLIELADKKDRSARFRCVIALSSPTGETETVDGKCEGRITVSPRGSTGFGYDPLFVPQGHQLTFAEMGSTEKNAISHRGKALAAAMKRWKGTIADA